MSFAEIARSVLFLNSDPGPDATRECDADGTRKEIEPAPDPQSPTPAAVPSARTLLLSAEKEDEMCRSIASYRVHTTHRTTAYPLDYRYSADRAAMCTGEIRL